MSADPNKRRNQSRLVVMRLPQLQQQYSAHPTTTRIGTGTSAIYRQRRCILHPPGEVFEARLLDKPRGCQYRTTRLRKALDEMFTTPTCSAPTLFQLWRYRAWKIGPGGAGVMHTVVYASASSTNRASTHERHQRMDNHNATVALYALVTSPVFPAKKRGITTINHRDSG